MEGLRGERQLWGRELAQQGAELAQDRGRMEAQIEALSSENASLCDKLEVKLLYSTVWMDSESCVCVCVLCVCVCVCV